ncbi:MAG: four helix bundle protein [Flavobacteriaceae bacterium]|jgi:hypothetical protein|nr:four helix bundle protein [Flavobacteriaceae bacterium]
MEDFKRINAWIDSVRLSTTLFRLAVKFESINDRPEDSDTFISDLKNKLVLIPTKIAYASQLENFDEYLKEISISLIYLYEVKAYLKKAYNQKLLNLELLNIYIGEIDKISRAIQQHRILRLYQTIY